jgi:hypothetical protein
MTIRIPITNEASILVIKVVLIVLLLLLIRVLVLIEGKLWAHL